MKKFSNKQIVKIAKAHVSSWDTFFENTNDLSNNPEAEEYLNCCKSVRALWQSIIDKNGQGLTEEESYELKVSMKEFENSKSN